MTTHDGREGDLGRTVDWTKAHGALLAVIAMRRNGDLSSVVCRRTTGFWVTLKGEGMVERFLCRSLAAAYNAMEAWLDEDGSVEDCKTIGGCPR